jgi:hypothetical protein
VCARGCRQPCSYVWCSVSSRYCEHLFRQGGGEVIIVGFAGVLAVSLVLGTGVGHEAVGPLVFRIFGTCVYVLSFYVGSEVSSQWKGFRLN